MKLYYSAGASSLPVRILINTLGLPCEYESVDTKKKLTSSGADFLAINPKGKIPTLILDNKEILTEAPAIMQYLADQQPSHELLPASGLERYRVIEWLSYLNCDVYKILNTLLDPSAPKLPDDVKEQGFLPVVKKNLNILEAHLKKHPMLANDRFSIADCYAGVLLLWLPYLKLSISDWPSVERYSQTLMQREAFPKSLKEEKLI